MDQGMRKRPQNEFRHDGFSLAELMAVIGIMGIIAAVTVPGFLQWLPNYYLKAP
jgi:prepilin-type N-terminal cleavage/methylation domain-containing protein